MSTPPVAPPPTQPAAPETRPAWVIKLEQDLAAIQQQEQQQQQAAQLAQQQAITVEEVKDDEPLSYAEGTPQPLTEVPAFPGHYQIEFPGEQIEGETNSDVSEIENLNHFPSRLGILDLLVSRCHLHLEDLLPFPLDNLLLRPYIYNHFPSSDFEAGSLTTERRKSS